MFDKQPNDFMDYSSVRPSLKIEQSDTKAIEAKLNHVNKVVIPALSKRIKETQDRDHEYFMRKHRIIHTPHPIGSIVYVENKERTSKSDARYDGPLIVTNMTTNGLYVLEWKNNGSLYSRDFPTSHIKVASADGSAPSSSFAPDESTPDEHFEVQAILDHRGTHGNYEYLVQWKGYNDPKDNTWIPTDNFDTTFHIERYWGRRQSHKVSTSGRNRRPKTVNTQKFTPRLRKSNGANL